MAKKAAYVPIPDNEVQLLSPEMVEKLVRHFGRRAKIRVLIDYSPSAVPWASPDGVVSIPAWMRADQIRPLLGAILHETGHIEFDKADNKRLLTSGMHKSPVYYLFYNVCMDARLDTRRLEEYPGARSMYEALWIQEKVSTKIGAYKGAARATGCLKVALGKAIGMEAFIAPELLEQIEREGKTAAVEELTAILMKTPKVKGSLAELVAGVVNVLLRHGPWEPEMGCISWEDHVRAATGEAAFSPEKAAVILKGAQEKMRRFENDGGDPKKLVGVAMGKALNDAIAYITGTPPTGGDGAAVANMAAGLNPVENVDYEKPDLASIRRAITTFFREAVNAFVSAVEDVAAPDEFPYQVDPSKLARAVTYPDDVMLGDKIEHLTSAVVDIIVDVSGSMFDESGPNGKVNRALEAARLWVETAKEIGAQRVKVGFVPFASVAKRAVKFTDLANIRSGHFSSAYLKKVDVGGGTNLEEAVKLSEEELRGHYAKRRAIVVITDGEVSEDAVQRCRKLLHSDIRMGILTVVHQGAADDYIADLVSTDVFNYVAKSREATETAFAKALLDACARGFDD